MNYTIQDCKDRIKEVGKAKKYSAELIQTLLDRLKPFKGQLKPTQEVINNTYNIIPKMFERVVKNRKKTL